MRRVFVCFLEEIEDSKKTFRNYLTFSVWDFMVSNIQNVNTILKLFWPLFASLGEERKVFFLSLTIFLFSICILPGVNRIGKPPWKIVVQNHLMHLNYHHMYILSSMCTYLYLCSSCFWDLLTTWYVHTDVSLWNDMFLLTYTYAEKDNLFVSDINHKFEYLYH